MTEMDSVAYFRQLAEWLQWESEAEKEQLASRLQQAARADVERSGDTLVDLVVEDHDLEVGGRTLLTLVKRNRTQRLPWNRFRVGSPIVLSSLEDPSATQYGVVTAAQAERLQVSTDQWPEGDRFRIDLCPDEITRRRQRAALRVVQEARGRVGELRKVLLGGRAPRFGREMDCTFGAELDHSQRQAIRFALTAEDVAIIHGPPGTGKTTTLVELMCQAVARGGKVLACAPSNTAVDNLLERLVARRQKVVRLGHPARVDAQLREYTLDAQVAGDDTTRLVHELRRQAEQLWRKAGRYTRAKPAPGEKQAWRQEARQLQVEARQLERQTVASVLDRADVVCATTTFSEELLGERRFDWVIIDEACQSTEPGCWVPVIHGDKLILAGDHCQLPPTVLSAQALRAGFGVSLLERLVQLYGELITRRLDVQYRMHADIMAFSSRQFYDGTLAAHTSVASHLLSDLPSAEPSPLVCEPVTFIDTAGAGWNEEPEPDGESRCNPREGKLILAKLRQLSEAGIPLRDIAVITPYAAQVRWLRQHCHSDEVEIDSVDGFQGREKEAVLISCVRSNSSCEIGFLADTRRMNVALTRARRKLLVVGDSATLGGHEFYCALLAHFEAIGAYHTVWEEPDDM